ncbi:unnamed protein product [Pieris brassicae]|uniref:Major facilitator superfamily (MFS) profile domain-containing protein n=1 Tax=Pieris brassicae TaxID=7116 RepID=A0A9P0SHG5_PIEBR|nr:unnamed protein product [Pieris brassicae]
MDLSSSEIKEVENKPKTIEDVNVALENVIQHAGELGLYQKLLFFAMFPFALMRSLSIPINSAGSYERCRMFDANWTHVLETLQPPDEETPLTLCNNGWEFLFNDIPYETIATEREWVCNKASYIPTVTTFGFAGTLLGVITLGVLADYFGRVPLIIEAGVLEFIKTKELRLTSVLLIVAIMSTTLSFDTILRMSENIGLNIFITFTVSAATEVPSISLLVFLLDRFGRRWLVFCPVIATIILNMTNAFVSNNFASGALLVSARFFNIMAYNTLIQWTPELLPTSMRASGGALIFTFGNLPLLLSSFVVFSAQYWPGLPFLIISVFAILGASCALFIPETMGKPMPQTVEDIRNLSRII